MKIQKVASVNVHGHALAPCSTDPLTGFFRNGACDTCESDAGSHTVCVIMTAEFLAYSKYFGNDLTTPRPEFGFAGLKPGDIITAINGHRVGTDPVGQFDKVLSKPNAIRLGVNRNGRKIEVVIVPEPAEH